MTDNRQLYVLCDTNAAVRDAHLFRKKGGPQLVALLRAKKAKLLVPEVLRMEYVNQFKKSGDEVRNKTMVELDKLKTLCGYDISTLLPKAEFGEAQALDILKQLEDIIHTIPTTPELKVAAADRSIDNVRPASKSDHGYKDCLIWESMLTLPRGSEVILLSRDEVAFFDGEVLARSLQKEAEENGLLLTAYNTKRNETLWPEALKVKAVIDANKEYAIYKTLVGFEGVFGDWSTSMREESFSLGSQDSRMKEARVIASRIADDGFDVWRQRILTFAKTESNDLATFPVFYEFLADVASSYPAFALNLLIKDSDALSKFLISDVCFPRFCQPALPRAAVEIATASL